MRKPFLLFICLGFLAVQLYAQTEGTKTEIVIESESLQNNFLGDSPAREVLIYLPPGYTEFTENRYPVLYLLHGYSANHNLWNNSGYISFDLKQTMDELIGNRIMEPIIVVAPNSQNAYNGSWYTNSEATGNWEDFIVKDLVKYIDAHYRTLPQAESRGIAGHSMGGYGAMKLAMKFPSIFQVVHSMSGSLNFEYRVSTPQMKTTFINASEAQQFDGIQWEVQGAISMTAAFSPDTSESPLYCNFPVTPQAEVIDSIYDKWLLHDVSSLVTEYKDSLAALAVIQFDCGTEDEIPHTENQLFSGILEAHNIVHSYMPYEGNHTNKIAERMEWEVLPFISQNLVHSESNVSSLHSAIFESWSVYPNPVADFVTVKSPEAGEYLAEIYSTCGRRVGQANLSGDSFQIDLSYLVAGVYFIHLSSDNFLTVQRFIKK